ncbi:MAG: class I SAM-dependent methyltransferase, partial [Patescibacteria group bacterium]
CDLEGPGQLSGRYSNDNGTVQIGRGSITKIPSPDHSFEMVVCIMVFHHIDPKLYVEALQEIARVLMPKGKLLVIDHGQPTRWYGWLWWLMFSRHRFSRNCTDKVIKAAGKAGFKRVRLWGTTFGWTHAYIFSMDNKEPMWDKL